MSADLLSPRNLAAAFAVGGLGAMMTAPEPSWHSVGIGLACLVAFGGLSLVPSPRADQSGPKGARRRSGRRPGAEDGARAAPAEAPYAAPEPLVPYAAPEPLAPRGLNDPHPALFKGMHTRRGGTAR